MSESASFDTFWQGRSQQERKLLSFAAIFGLFAVLYLLAFDPAISGHTQLQKDLPKLREQASHAQSLIQEAQRYASITPGNVTPITKESLEQMMSQRGLTPTSVQFTSDFTVVKLSNVSFANLASWLAEVQKTSRISVLEASIVAQSTVGNVNASLTLRQQLQ
jgi:general secretion pathway protein M